MIRFRKLSSLTSLLIVSALAASVPAQAAELNIVVAPSTLNLASNGGCVTIHAEIGYGAAQSVELFVNGQNADVLFTFPDSRGELVVRCGIETIKQMVSVGEATFVLTVHTANGTYTGSDTIRVIDRGD